MSKRKQRKEEKERVNKISDLEFMYLAYGKKALVVPIVIAIILGVIIWGIVYNTRKNNAPQETADNEKEQINYIWGEIKPGKKNANNYTMVTSAGVQMIWGIQWDETLKWLIDTGEKTYAEIASDSKSWGNYVNNSFTYYTNTSKSTAIKPSGYEKSVKIPSGAYEGTNANNVFDLAGNVLEWTLESNGSGTANNRSNRGGCYYSYDYIRPVAGENFEYPNYGSDLIGLRCTLFIK